MSLPANKAPAYAVKHVTVTERNTMLKERIAGTLPKYPVGQIDNEILGNPVR